jgi:hypothetical protein
MYIFFSEIYGRLSYGSIAGCLNRIKYPATLFKACFLKLWLYKRRRANRLLVSQVSFNISSSFFRHRTSFVVDLLIRLMKNSLTITTLIFCFIFCLSFLYNPAEAQAQNGFVQPISGDVLSGIVIVQGTAADANFLRYELAFLNESGGGDWIVFAQGDQQVIDGTLAVWDTTVGGPANRIFPDGRYQLRLRVVRQDFNYDEYFVINLTIANDSGTPTPTPTLTTTVPAETAAPSGVETVPPLLTQPAPDVLPSLTPFPTLTPQATPVNAPLGPGSGSSGETEESQGVFEQISGIDAGQFESAFWQGVRFVLAIFGLLAAYLLLRGFFRRLWRLLSNRLLR